jgi:predicted enzyme related to lactoylglutathione lyase
MRVKHAVLAICVLVGTAALAAQETGIRVRSIRVLATDPEAIAAFYKKAFGMSEIRRVGNAPAGAMASLILEVPDLNKAIEAVKANGGTLMRPPGKSGDLQYAFLKDPDGNQVELVMSPK